MLRRTRKESLLNLRHLLSATDRGISLAESCPDKEDKEARDLPLHSKILSSSSSRSIPSRFRNLPLLRCPSSRSHQPNRQTSLAPPPHIPRALL